MAGQGPGPLIYFKDCGLEGCQVSPGGEFLFARAKRNQKRAGGRPRRDCKRQGRAFALSGLTPGPLFITRAHPNGASVSFRRTKSGHTKHPLPLPLHSTMFQCLHPKRPRLGCLTFAADVPCKYGTVPLMPTRTLLSAAHGRAPGLGTNPQQACPVGPAESYNCQQSGERKLGASCVSLPHAGRRRTHRWMLSRKMGVLRGKIL